MSQCLQSFYPAQPWQLTETCLEPKQLGLSETLFAQGNGYLGIRGVYEEGGVFEEGVGASLGSASTFLNGVYTAEPITYGEKAYGYARNNQRMVSAPNGTLIELYVDGERFTLAEGQLLNYERSLDFRTGQLRRRLMWRSPVGKTLLIESSRLVSLVDKHLCVLDYRVTALDFSGWIQLVSGMDAQLPGEDVEDDDPRAGSRIDSRDIELLQRQCREGQILLLQQIHSSGFYLASGATHQVHSECEMQIQHAWGEDGAEVQFEGEVQQGQTLGLTKYLGYFSYDSSSYSESGASAKAPDYLKALGVYLDQVSSKSFTHYAELQQNDLDNFWATADVEVRGDESLQQGMRFNLFQLYQSLGRDGKTNIAAKGLTGDGYDGHYFWDTEIYILPFFLYSQPELARKLLEYRHSTLDAARERARELAFDKGALFPWRTIGGEECSAYYPAGTAQYHINADIAYAIQRYYEATGDKAFMRDYGAEVVLESARIWMYLGCYDQEQRFCLNTVTGPDEYTALVNNNLYTNVMAKTHLQFAVLLLQWLETEEPETYQVLREKLALEPQEGEEWRRAAEAMYLPYDTSRGIHAQDDSFLNKAVWDFDNTPAEHYPLLLHYHPLVIYRYQVCKQADVMLALLLRSDAFSVEQKRRDFDYYEPITTHDSTLSACIHSIIASEVGYRDKALNYFRQVARMDLDNHHNNTQYGVHTACMGGTWLCMVNGFAGMRVEKQLLRFDPYLPSGMTGYKFRLQFKGSLVEVDVSEECVRYALIAGESLTIVHRGAEIALVTSVVEPLD